MRLALAVLAIVALAATTAQASNLYGMGDPVEQAATATDSQAYELVTICESSVCRQVTQRVRPRVFGMGYVQRTVVRDRPVTVSYTVPVSWETQSAAVVATPVSCEVSSPVRYVQRRRFFRRVWFPRLRGYRFYRAW